VLFLFVTVLNYDLDGFGKLCKELDDADDFLVADLVYNLLLLTIRKEEDF